MKRPTPQLELILMLPTVRTSCYPQGLIFHHVYSGHKMVGRVGVQLPGWPLFIYNTLGTHIQGKHFPEKF
jgi:hypothetical protein